METHMGEKTGNQKESRHPEHMDGKEQHPECDAGMTVLDDPDPGRCRNEWEGCVQDDAEQQGEAPDGVQGMQPIRCGVRVVNLRHGMPQDRTEGFGRR
jgi:hypothetical protein